MTLQTNKNDPNNGGRQELEAKLRSIWLGWRDSNPRYGDTVRLISRTARALCALGAPR
jgi:hypothetical protein